MKFENIYFFSTTAQNDTVYKPLFWYLINNNPKFKTLTGQIHKSVNIELINDIVKKQEVIGMN